MVSKLVTALRMVHTISSMSYGSFKISYLGDPALQGTFILPIYQYKLTESLMFVTELMLLKRSECPKCVMGQN